MNGDKLRFGQGASVRKVCRGGGGVGSNLQLVGGFKVQHYRKGLLLAEYDFPNAITDEGKNLNLNVFFNGATAIGATKFFLGLIDATSDVLATTDTYAEINDANGWDEFDDYTDAANASSAVTRPNWNPGNSTTKQVINASPIVFDITGTGTVSGLFVVGGPTTAQTKGDNTASGNVLWATAAFTGGDVPVAALDQLKATYFTNA